ncbi:hypothetical protein BMT54_06500 [Pasteurellaceae bacterium 15-036681]|nr:hypothetical protein BMT54_06500 [Pasteurellaceae bacterium 15-036681]
MKTLRETLLSQTPQLKPIEIKGTTYYVRELTVGDMNNQIFKTNKWLKEQAELEGYELPPEDDKNFEQTLNEFGSKYHLARNIAHCLCDENGELLFDPFNVEDLNAISKLDSSILAEFNAGLGEPKNSQTADDSN